MQCPSCGRRYGIDALHCRRCDTALVAGAASARESAGTTDDADDDVLVPLVRLAHPAEIPVVKSLLDAEGIPYLIQGEHAMALEPLAIGLAFGMGEIGSLLLVPRRCVEEARELLDSTLDVEAFDEAVEPDGEPLG